MAVLNFGKYTFQKKRVAETYQIIGNKVRIGCTEIRSSWIGSIYLRNLTSKETELSGVTLVSP